MKIGKTVWAGVLAAVWMSSGWAANEVVVVPLVGDTYQAAVPKTGQIDCYDVTDVGFSVPVVPCTGTGQDGEYQKGVAWPDPRFSDLGDGSVRDKLTSLVWLKNADCRGTNSPSVGGKVNMVDAYDYVMTLNGGNVLGNCGDLGMHDDWRIPNRFELESLLDLSQSEPPLVSGHPFTYVRYDYYWTSSYQHYFVDVGSGWVVGFSAGLVDQFDWISDTAYVWPVRGGH